MILSHFFGRCGRILVPDHILKESRGREQGEKMAQKGVFTTCCSFAIGSKKRNLYGRVK